MNKGSHPIHRSLLDNEIWKEKPFSKGHAWVDMILRANYKQRKFTIDNEEVIINRGQLVTSILGMSERFGWSRCKTRGFIDILKNRHMIRHQRRHNALIITLLNYGILHDKVKKVDTKLDTKPDSRPTADRQPLDTSNKDNKVNKVNKEPISEQNLTPLQQIIEHYYDVRNPGSSRTWRNGEFAKHLKFGKKLLELTENNIEESKSTITKALKFFKDMGVDWKLSTVVGRFPDIVQEKGENNEEPERPTWSK